MSLNYKERFGDKRNKHNGRFGYEMKMDNERTGDITQTGHNERTCGTKRKEQSERTGDPTQTGNNDHTRDIT